MAEIGRRRAQIFLIVEEIMVESFLCVLNLLMTRIHNNNRTRRRRESRVIRYVMVDRIFKQVEHMQDLIEVSDVYCLDDLRMTRVAFSRWCCLLKHVGGHTDSRYVSVNEKVALFISILAHHKKVRIVRFNFKRSGQTVSASCCPERYDEDDNNEEEIDEADFIDSVEPSQAWTYWRDNLAREMLNE
ncbi:hypothetical protein DH2020_039373 [Rehmannia glutinosa]|uniref:DUF8040 domain-containing protein n=1 Tax=Rehmannia glutinosa TaxID=99300 RepID=A0ABR0UW00_REHGL